jgi:hypothetical protein
MYLGSLSVSHLIPGEYLNRLLLAGTDSLELPFEVSEEEEPADESGD